MARRSDARPRMVQAAQQLIRERGYHATAISDVLERSAAPRGSVYFHFPGGKAQLAIEAAEAHAHEQVKYIDQAAELADSAAQLIENYLDLGRDGLGELCLLAFMYRHTRNLGGALIALMGVGNFPKGAIRRRALGALFEGFSHGGRSTWLPAIRKRPSVLRPSSGAHRSAPRSNRSFWMRASMASISSSASRRAMPIAALVSSTAPMAAMRILALEMRLPSPSPV